MGTGVHMGAGVHVGTGPHVEAGLCMGTGLCMGMGMRVGAGVRMGAGVHAWLGARLCMAGSSPLQGRKRAERGSVPQQASQHNSSLSNALAICSQRYVRSAIWAGLPEHKAASVPSLFPTSNSSVPFFPMLKSAFTHKASACPRNSLVQKRCCPFLKARGRSATLRDFPRRD